MRLLCAALMMAAGGAAFAANSQWQVVHHRAGRKRALRAADAGCGARGHPAAGNRDCGVRGHPPQLPGSVRLRRRHHRRRRRDLCEADPGQQQAFLTAYFDPKQGLGYSVLRTTIHSSDFSSGSYTYVKDGDRSLASFNIDHDMKYRVPLLRQALAAGQAKGTQMRVFASPWSAPAWMKSNKSMVGGGTLLPEYQRYLGPVHRQVRQGV
jgi:hypothetical protein